MKQRSRDLFSYDSAAAPTHGGTLKPFHPCHVLLGGVRGLCNQDPLTRASSIACKHLWEQCLRQTGNDFRSKLPFCLKLSVENPAETLPARSATEYHILTDIRGAGDLAMLTAAEASEAIELEGISVVRLRETSDGDHVITTFTAAASRMLQTVALTNDGVDGWPGISATAYTLSPPLLPEPSYCALIDASDRGTLMGSTLLPFEPQQAACQG